MNIRHEIRLLVIAAILIVLPALVLPAGIVRTDWCFHHDRPTGVAGLCATAVSRAGLCVDARLLGLWSGGLFLGPRHMGRRSRWFVVDSGLLGMGWRSVFVACRILGTARWILRRN